MSVKHDGDVNWIGNMASDPEAQDVGSGNLVTFSIAINRSWQDNDGNWQDDVAFIDIATWGKTADKAMSKLEKGDSVLVDGYIKQDSWEQDGQQRSKLKVTARNVEKIVNGDVEASGGSQQASPDEILDEVDAESEPNDEFDF